MPAGTHREAELLRPSRESFDGLARRGNWIPVVREIRADLDTALSLFKRLDDGETSFLFESVEGAEKWARYSFMGRGARAIFRSRITSYNVCYTKLLRGLVWGLDR